MNLPDDKLISVLTAHFLSDSGGISSTRYEADLHTNQLISKTPFVSCEIGSRNIDENFQDFLRIEDVEFEEVQVYKFEEGTAENMDPSIKRKFKLNVPFMIRCQNCETNYPTKYQYQRHQCEFNADKVVLKPNADLVEAADSKNKKIKYNCNICGKQFVSKNNLERHQTSHANSNDTTCEHCNKQFVSENRLRIHKENHCKKAGDISKFYRSDVTVWRCRKCQEVFSSSATAGYHVEVCEELWPESGIKQEPLQDSNEQNGKTDYKVIEKISTEILLQCEFCNRTYADKFVLLKHQKLHKTDKNYECVICKDVFASYILASQHWLKKCSEKANLFYLPKLTYCEFCDRTFKSHELLYTHKIKKKHYSPKKFNEGYTEKTQSTKCLKGEDNIDKLIEDVLMALEIPINKKKKMDESNNNSKGEKVDDEAASLNDDDGTVEVKTEPLIDCHQEQCLVVDENILPEKKKRGRKRKMQKQAIKSNNKKPFLKLTDGLKYQCERCVEVFDTIMELETHREKEHAANFNCDECGQVLHSARALLIHSRAHKSLKPYVCDTCGRSYSQTSHLWQHMRFHQGIKPFACPHEGCEARYTIRPDLKDHIRKVHTRERPFKCTVCGKCFLTGSVYYQHRLIHTEDRRYGCDMCEKRFFRADALNNHKRIHTNERPYPCFVCGRLFRQKGDRNKHFRTQHPDAIIS